MTLEEALTELGVDAAMSAEEVRRAYLRLVKTRKPETDPEGFLRLREAYELISRFRSLAASREVSRGTTYWAAPVPASSVNRSVVAPGAVPTGESSAAPSSRAPASEPMEELGQLLASDDAQAASGALSQLYRSATGRPDVMVPPPRVAIDLLFRLYERGATTEAHELDQSFRLWLRATCNEVGTLGPSSVAWALACSIGALPEETSPEVRAAMVSAWRTGRTEGARKTLSRLRVDMDLETAASNARALRTLGSPLARELAKILDPGGRVSARRQIWFLLVVVVPLLRTLSVDHCRETTSSPPVATVMPTPNVYGERYEGRIAIDSLDRLAKTAADLGESPIAMSARSLQTVLTNGGCDGLRVQARELSVRDTCPQLRAQINESIRALGRACAWPEVLDSTDASVPRP
jgi:hypothetical protein